jgi:hypothetical protein
MTIKHMVREAMKRVCSERGVTLAEHARRRGMHRQQLYRKLEGAVSDRTVGLCCGILRTDRAGFERMLLCEWRRALEAGCTVEPPRIHWQTLHVTITGDGLEGA